MIQLLMGIFFYHTFRYISANLCRAFSLKFLLCLFLLTEVSFAITKEEFEKIKNQRPADFIDGGEKAYERRVGPPITSEYFRGSNLIYNCKKRHFACVSESNYEDCEKQREKDIEDKTPLFQCVGLKKFKKQEECFKTQMRAVHQVVSRSFCLPSP